MGCKHSKDGDDDDDEEEKDDEEENLVVSEDEKLEEEEEEDEEPPPKKAKKPKEKQRKKTVQNPASGLGHASADMSTLLCEWLPISVKEGKRDHDYKEYVHEATVTVHKPNLVARLRKHVGIHTAWEGIKHVSVGDLEVIEKARLYRWHHRFDIHILPEDQFKIAVAILNDYVNYKCMPDSSSLLENWAALLSVESPFVPLIGRHTHILVVYHPEHGHDRREVVNYPRITGKHHMKTSNEEDERKFHLALQHDCQFLKDHKLVGYKGHVDIHPIGHSVVGAYAVPLAESSGKRERVVAVCTIQDFLHKQSMLSKIVNNPNNPSPRAYAEGFMSNFHSLFRS